ncbi:MAG: tRNA pseudouridine(55) synthase TruB [Gracilibacteraceae bacterium]|jgi:tRNA pseudouridine55 synthase|nr:tRNA pseudouridine(55) synthase TruB [Gracilibacteraceae bacterium]
MINLRKESGMTSMDALRRLRSLLRVKKTGHCGTLDPSATGVLPVCLGQATRLAEYYTGQKKRYRAEATFGVVTDTQDADGTVLRREAPRITQAEAKDALFSFVGKIKQIPPMFSAVRHKGQRLYDLARRGEVVERAERETEIYGMEWLAWTPGLYPRAVFEVACSHGTYIRALCDDLGKRLGCGAHLSALCRLETGSFYLEESVGLAEVAARFAEGDLTFMLPLGWGLDLPALEMPLSRAEAFRRGLPSDLGRLGAAPLPNGPCAVYCAGELLGVGRAEAGELRPDKVLRGDGGDGAKKMIQGG